MSAGTTADAVQELRVELLKSAQLMRLKLRGIFADNHLEGDALLAEIFDCLNSVRQTANSNKGAKSSNEQSDDTLSLVIEILRDAEMPMSLDKILSELERLADLKFPKASFTVKIHRWAHAAGSSIIRPSRGHFWHIDNGKEFRKHA